MINKDMAKNNIRWLLKELAKYLFVLCAPFIPANCWFDLYGVPKNDIAYGALLLGYIIMWYLGFLFEVCILEIKPDDY